jgi:hypothetical protein
MKGSSMIPRILKVILFLSAVLTLSREAMCNPAGSGPSADSFETLKKSFAHPAAEYRTMPFWVWNDKVDREKIGLQLDDFKKQGFGGVFIHPRYGLVTEYLSQEWFDLVGYAVQKAKSLGIAIWLYDENSFPSGFAGGHVPARMPGSCDQGQGLVMNRRPFPEDSLDRIPVILQSDGDHFVRVHHAGDAKPGLEYLCFEKTYYEKSKWYGGFSYVDLLLPGVTDTFIRVTMEGYERSIGSEFGKTVPGIFTDEPHLEPPGGKRPAVRWTPDLFDVFRKRWGYDLEIHLPGLLEETGDWKRVRHNYYQVLLELFIERWAKPWYRYCEDRGIDWTGHYWEHAWPSPRGVPDNMAMSAWQQVPGIDMLFNTMDRKSEQFGNIHAVRELSSVANQLGRKRTLSETYGAAGWELTFTDMKRLGDWEFCLGVNLMNQHLSYMTLTGDRKHDFPLSFSYHEPWWPCYRYLADYFARLSAALSTGVQENRILVLEPTTSCWMYDSPKSRHDRLDETSETFRLLLDTLENRQVEYDLGCEAIMKDAGRVRGGILEIGKGRYDRVILPPGAENLNLFTSRLIEQYLEGGGQLISIRDALCRLDGRADPFWKNLAGRFPDSWVKREDIGSCIPEWNKPDFRITFTGNPGKWVFHQRRILEDGQLLFLVNSSLSDSASGEVLMPGQSVFILDAFSGKVEPYPADIRKGLAVFRFRLQPAGSLLFFSGDAGSSQPSAKPAGSWRSVQASGVAVRRLSPNVLNLDYCDVRVAGQEKKGIYFYTVSDLIFKSHGFDDNPWVSSSQYRTEILDREPFSAGTGFEADFHFKAESGPYLEFLKAVVERPGLWNVTVNGEPVEPDPGAWWLDRSFGVYSVGRSVRPGDNILGIVLHPMSVHAELEPVYLIGDFSCMPADQGWEIGPATPSLSHGSWKEQGMPFYSHGVSYERTVSLSSGKRVRILPGAWKGAVIQVRVNGRDAGIIAWSPGDLDISPCISDGFNRIELVVYGTLKNLLGPHHNVNRRGIVTPWSFKYAPEHQPPGGSYDLESYGMDEPFQVVKEE